MSPISFEIQKRAHEGLARAGKITTPHGVIETPAFVVVGTKATVKALTPEQVKSLGAQVVLGNTYHLYLEPGEKIIEGAGGLGKFMHWEGPTMTDSGGFQVFSLGAAFGKGISKFTVEAEGELIDESHTEHAKLATIDDDGVVFRAHTDGKEHRITPERSTEIQHAIGADIIFAFDEPTAPAAPEEYQRQALARTHAWAKRCLDFHNAHDGVTTQGLFGVVQGGRYQTLREESAKILAAMDFAGYGIGGSYTKEHIAESVGVVNNILPENKSRHLLGIGEPEDLFLGVQNGCDLFDCVLPTRIARNGTLYTPHGKINITNAKFTRDFSPIDEGCACYTCANFTKAYLSHLFRAKEMLAATLASIHNLYFIVHLVKSIRQSILDDTFEKTRTSFMAQYKL